MDIIWFIVDIHLRYESFQSYNVMLWKPDRLPNGSQNTNAPHAPVYSGAYDTTPFRNTPTAQHLCIRSCYIFIGF